VAIPTVEVEGLELSRIVCGTNPFFGFSHFSAARDRWMKRYFTDDRIVEVLAKCADLGVNCVLGGAGERMRRILDRVEQLTGVHLYWMRTPSGFTPEEIIKDTSTAAELAPEICMPHQMYTDNNLIAAENRIVGAEEVLAHIRSLGMIPGWSSHRPEVIITTDRAGYDVQFMIQPYNAIGFLCQVETDWLARVITNTPKHVIAIKPLAAGRILPPTGLRFVLSTIKPIDLVAIGFSSPEEVEEDLALVESIFEGLEAPSELTHSRSKKILES